MKYTSKININLNLETFIKKLISTENLKHWHLGLTNYDHIYGTPGKTGSKIRLHYVLDKKKFYLVQTISKNALPYELDLTYESTGLYTLQKNNFEVVSDFEVLWTSENEIIPTNFKMRMMLLIMPNTFKKQTKIYLENFKNFAENNISINHRS